MKVLLYLRRLCAAAILLLFLLFALQGAGLHLPDSFLALCKLQFGPAAMSALQGIRIASWALCMPLAVLLLLSLLFGRVFCSWLCPLGIAQDLVHRIFHPHGNKGKAARFRPNRPLLRGLIAAAVWGSLLAGNSLLLTYLEPYSIFSRFVHHLLSPREWHKMLAEGSLSISLPAMAVIALSFLIPIGLAAWRGRLYCNSICPVGSLLGLLALPAPFRPKMQVDRCKRCGKCLSVCPAQAIDLKNGRIDASRCVACYRCVAQCREQGIVLSRGQAAADSPKASRSRGEATTAATEATEATLQSSRRAFLGMGLLSLATAALPDMPEGTCDADPRRLGNNRSHAALPPGAGSAEDFLNRCTGCGLCISACPSGVLRPSFSVLGWQGLMKPYMDYSQGFCKADCRRCSEVCPEQALAGVRDLAQKQHTQIALASLEQDKCRLWLQGEACGLCAKSCPNGALQTVEANIPFVEEEDCVGCGRCARVCPQAAISFREDEEGRYAVIDRSRCIGCGACAAACRRHKAIRTLTLHRPLLRHPELCTGCGACRHACPAQPKAISLTPRKKQLPCAEHAEQPDSLTLS